MLQQPGKQHPYIIEQQIQVAAHLMPMKKNLRCATIAIPANRHMEAPATEMHVQGFGFAAVWQAFTERPWWAPTQ